MVFFDCDDCLYFDNWNIAGHLTTKIEGHCQNAFNLRGLIAEGYLDRDCQESMDGFLDTVHDLPIHQLLAPDDKLRQIILAIDPKVRK